MNVRPQFLRWISIFFVCGLLLIAFVYFEPHINLPRPPKTYCPILAWLKPLSKAPVKATDSLELITYVGKPGIPYTVRIYGDGRVERDTVISLVPSFHVGCPLHGPDRHARVSPARATAIIAKARDGGFCRLCKIYQSTYASTDDQFQLLTLNFNGKTNMVANSGHQPPHLFAELVSSFNEIPSIPDYAKSDLTSPQRQAECSDFIRSQIDNLQKHLNQH